MYAPVGGERVDEEQATAAVLVPAGSPARRQGGVGVGDLDTDDAPTLVVGQGQGQGQGQGEVSSGDAAMEDGVRGEFGDDEDGGVVRLGAVRVSPLGELLRGEQPGEARTASGGGEALRERTDRDGALGARGWHAAHPVGARGPVGRSRADTDHVVLVHALDWVGRCT